MKRRTALILIVVGAVRPPLGLCLALQQPAKDQRLPEEKKKVLIVYLSRTKNTKAIAEMM
jgi:hypothetical protein